MKFKKEFYHFQNDILDKFESEIKRGDKKIHIVAPPGSGKTVVGLEMVSRISGNALILVPNITLQYQWKDKLEKLFLETNENIDEIVSTSTEVIKKVNIITYQALTQSGEGDDIITQKIFESWYNDIKSEFGNYKEFEDYIENLKKEDSEDFLKTFTKYRKKQKKITSVENLITDKVKDYFYRLKNNSIDVVVVDEAHHLTNWWSSVIYYLRQFLGKKFIVGLTATPPFENTDFFILDNDYSKLLGEVDYYVPQPAIIKSGRLAPYQDLVYFVEPNKDLENTLQVFEKELQNFLMDNKEDIENIIYDFISTNFDKLLNEKQNILNNLLRYLYNNSEKDISDYITNDAIGDNLEMEDIAKTIGKYISIKKINKNINYKSVKNKNINYKSLKKIFYNLGYIWRGANFYRFRTPIEMQLIYSKSKIGGIEKILDKEIEVLGSNLRCAIITDFLDENENNYINCKYILNSLKEKYKDFHPVLVSGQGNFQIGNDGNIEELTESIIDITQRFSNGEINILIGTRGILGEGWDCPKLNTLIDLTGIVAYMSVNQVRGRAIRLDHENIKKVSNIYDIVCIGKGYKGNIDIERLISKHEKFYGIDDSGLIIKGVNHIYPELKNNYKDFQLINKNMLLRAENRDFVYDLWGINGEFSNKEIFGLNLHICDYGEFLPIKKLKISEKVKLIKYFSNFKFIKEISSDTDFYRQLIYEFIKNFINILTLSLIQNKIIPENFEYKVILGTGKDIKVVSNYKDEIIIKSYMTYLGKVFSVISDQKYVLNIGFMRFDGNEIKLVYVPFGLGDELCKNEGFRNNLEKNILNNQYFFYENLYTVLDLFSNMFLNIFEFIFNYNSLKKYFFYSQFKSSNKLLCLKSDNINYKDYVGKRPFIISKIEKLWI